MSRYYSFLIVLLFLTGCSTKEIVYTETTKKVFEEEDNLIFQALLYQQKGEYANARKVYHLLYEQSQKRVYLSELASISFMINDKETMSYIMEGIKKYPQEAHFNRV